MSKNCFYKFGFFCAVFFASINAAGQCIWSQLITNAHSNTAHTITVNNPVGGNLQPLFPPLGTYNLTLNYLDDFNNPVTQTSTAAMVTFSNASQFVITDNSITFPTSNYDFPSTSGSAQLSGTGGFYTWTWANDQLLNCAPLPVTLISFTAQLFNSTTVKINWQTADEDQLSSYFIQRAPISNQVFNNIGQVTPFNTPGIHDYQYIDCQPLNSQNLYRLKTVDIDGDITYSPIRLVNCPTCNGTAPPANCSQVAIAGPSLVCNYGTFSVTGFSGCGYASATWSVSPSYLATITPVNSLSAFVSATGSGTVTITATLPGCGNFTKTLTVGIPPLVTSTNVYKTQAYTRYIITVSNPTGAATDYSWYTNGNYAGTGYSRTYYLYPGNYITYVINQNTPCGISTATGNLYYQTPPGGGGGGCIPVYTLQQSYGSGKIVISRPPCEPIPLAAADVSLKKNAIPDDYELRLLDFQGTIKKHVNHVSLKNSYSFNVSGLIPGNYIMQVVNRGVIEYSKKLRVD